MKKRLSLCVGMFLAMCTGGCATTFHETHFFKSGGENGEPTSQNFYRIEVSGGTAISSSRYVSGYFDPDAVDIYFNEIKQPKDGAIIPPPQKPSEEAKKEGDKEKAIEVAETPRPLSPSLEGKDLVLILSTNSEEIANQIGALAANQQFVTSLAGLAARGDYEAAAKSTSELELDQSSAKGLVTLAEATIGQLPEKPSAEQNKLATLSVLNRLAFELDKSGPFATLNDAEVWFNANRKFLSMEGGR